MFGLDTDGYTLFSGDPYNQQILSLISILLGDTQVNGDPYSEGAGVPELSNMPEEEIFSLISILLSYTQFSDDPNSEGSGVPDLNNMPEEEILSLISILLGDTQFSGDIYSQGAGVPELRTPEEEHDDVSVANAFGETFLYYTSRNPSTGMMQQKVTFVKRIVSMGLPFLIGRLLLG